MYDTVALGTFTVICNHHLYLVSKHIHHPERKLLIHEKETLISYSPFLQPPATTNPLPVSVDLPVHDASCRWNHTLCVLLCLPVSLSIVCSGSIHTVARVRLHCFSWLHNIPL